MKYVKFAGNTVGVITNDNPNKAVDIVYHNGVKPTHRSIEKRYVTEITAAEFEQAVRKKGDTAMLQYLVTTEIEAIVWHTDPNDLPEANKRCLVLTQGGSGIEGRAVFTGQNWRMNDGFRNEKQWIKAWAYEPTGPK